MIWPRSESDVKELMLLNCIFSSYEKNDDEKSPKRSSATLWSANIGRLIAIIIIPPKAPSRAFEHVLNFTLAVVVVVLPGWFEILHLLLASIMILSFFFLLFCEWALLRDFKIKKQWSREARAGFIVHELAIYSRQYRAHKRDTSSHTIIATDDCSTVFHCQFDLLQYWQLSYFAFWWSTNEIKREVWIYSEKSLWHETIMCIFVAQALSI